MIVGLRRKEKGEEEGEGAVAEQGQEVAAGERESLAQRVIVTKDQQLLC